MANFLIDHEYTLDITPSARPQLVPVSEYDVGRIFTFTLKHNGEEMTIPSSYGAVTVEGTIGSYAFSEPASIENGKIVFQLTESMTAHAGKAWTKIKFANADAPVSTCAFVLAVDRAGVEAETVIGGSGFEEQLQTAFTEYLEEHGTAPVDSGVDSVNGKSGVVVLKTSDIENDSGIEVVETYADLLTSTADRVHVLDISDGPFGIQGDCWFEKADVEWNATYGAAYAHRTSDGAVMVACTDQVPPPPPNFPVLSLGDCIGTYYRNADLVYGSLNTLFSDSAEAIDGKFQIDCASFVDAILGGITYEHSRYVLGTNAENIYGAYVGDNYLNARTRNIGNRTHGLGSIKQAEWFAQQKRLFKLPLGTGDYRDVVNKLRPGDVLFSGAATETASNNWNPYEIGHVQIVLAVFDDGVVLAAEGGGGPHNLDTTTSNVCNLETIDLKRQYSREFKTVRVFARPNYGGLPESLRPVAITSLVKANNGDPIASVARSSIEWTRLARVYLAEPLEPGKIYTLTITGRLPSATPIWMPHPDSTTNPNTKKEPIAARESGASIGVTSTIMVPSQTDPTQQIEQSEGMTLITTFGMPFRNEMVETVSIPFIYPRTGNGSSILNIYARESAFETYTDADGNPCTQGIGDGEQEYQIQSVEVTRGLGVYR